MVSDLLRRQALWMATKNEGLVEGTFEETMIQVYLTLGYTPLATAAEKGKTMIYHQLLHSSRKFSDRSISTHSPIFKIQTFTMHSSVKQIEVARIP